MWNKNVKKKHLTKIDIISSVYSGLIKADGRWVVCCTTKKDKNLQQSISWIVLIQT